MMMRTMMELTIIMISRSTLVMERERNRIRGIGRKILIERKVMKVRTTQCLWMNLVVLQSKRLK